MTQIDDAFYGNYMYFPFTINKKTFISFVVFDHKIGEEKKIDPRIKRKTMKHLILSWQ